MLFILLLLIVSILPVHQASHIDFNKHHCNRMDTNKIFHGNSITITTPSYQADKPITINVASCQNLLDTVVGFRALLLEAQIVNTGQEQKPLKSLLTFRWEPSFGFYGNMTFRVTALSRDPHQVFSLKLHNNAKLQGDVNQITIQQVCSTTHSSSSNASGNLIKSSNQWLLLIVALVTLGTARFFAVV
uniref:Secreted protein n=1 Tax=Clytia hemisphaerica TaxID=252671 RepID=A0A7M5X9B3_9CNID